MTKAEIITMLNQLNKTILYEEDNYIEVLTSSIGSVVFEFNDNGLVIDFYS